MSVYCNAALDDAPVASVIASEPLDRHDATPSAGPDPDRAVREMQVICAKHNAHCGAPDDLAAFLRALGTNKLLAMNFWSLVARLSEAHEGVALNPTELLAVIVRGVTGAGVEENDPSLTGRLARLLAGEDMPLAGDSPGMERAGAEVETAGPAGEPVSQSNAPAPASPAENPPLELDAPAAQPAAHDQVERSLVEHPVEEPTPVPLSSRGQRLELRPEPSSVPEGYPAAREERIPAFHSLAGYADADDRSRTGRRVAAAVLVVVLAAAGGLLFSRGYSAWQQPGNSAHDAVMSLGGRGAAMFSRIGDSLRAGVDSARDAWHGQSGAPQTVSMPQTVISEPPAAPAPAPLATRSSNKGAPSTADAAAAASAAAGASANQPAATERQRSIPGDQRDFNRRSELAASGEASSAESGRARAADPDAHIAGDGADTHGGEMVVVPGALMRDRLLSSRVPILPDGVASGGDAIVVVQAVVSSEGNVRDIHAIAGRPELRQAAMDAVSAWHYRPYLLNGTPVDVATTITVNFNGND